MTLVLDSKLSGPRVARLRRAVVRWFQTHQRDLPWRKSQDPYAVWVSEMMLQQTQVRTVFPYFERWMQSFPTIAALAEASEDEVLSCWQGLGYYSRARNLHRAARQVLDHHGGTLPCSVEQLMALPGIGRYSAGAIASIAFGQRAPLVDGNVVRVLTRLFGLRGDPARAPLHAKLWGLAEQLVPEQAPGDFNQGLMELGATVCTPRKPDCASCPLTNLCTARVESLVEQLPEIPKRPKLTNLPMAAALIQHRRRWLMQRLPSAAPRWAGLFRFPTIEVTDKGSQPSLRAWLRSELGFSVNCLERFAVIKHGVTRYRVTLEAFLCRIETLSPKQSLPQGFMWKRPDQIEGLALVAAHRRLVEQLFNEPSKPAREPSGRAR